MTYRSSSDFATETGAVWRFIRGMLRKMTFLLENGSKWQLRGQKGGQGGDEVIDVEPYSGIGFYAIPPSDGAPEVIVGSVGSPKLPVILSMRDEATRQKIAANMKPGSTCVYNGEAMLILNPDGTVEIRLIAGGVALALPTMDDYNALRAAFNGHAHPTAALGAPSPPQAAPGVIPVPVIPVPAPTGTTVLKAQ